MKCMDCLGNVTEDTRGEHRILENLYRTRAGRELLKILVSPKVSTLAGNSVTAGSPSVLLDRSF